MSRKRKDDKEWRMYDDKSSYQRNFENRMKDNLIYGVPIVLFIAALFYLLGYFGIIEPFGE